MSFNPNPIGVFDSGIGGISVLKHINTLMPNEHLIYVADSLHAPYGGKSAQEIQARCFSLADFLISRNVKALVVACNTATAAAIKALRAHYTLPIIGMEPAVKPAVLASKKGVIGVLATTGTLKSAQFAALLENYGRHVKIVTQGCAGLVECIERGELNATPTRQLLEKYMEPLLTEGADTIVLGCTHYPFVKPVIQEIAGDKITLVDTGAAVAKQLQRQLGEHQLFAPENQASKIIFWTNSSSPNAKDIIENLWGNVIDLQHF